MRQSHALKGAPWGNRESASRNGAAPRSLGRGDSVVGSLFCDLRRVLRLSQADLAQRLATTPGVIAALEGGDARDLPAWPETARVVVAFMQLANIDSSAVLQRLAQVHGAAQRRDDAQVARAPNKILAAVAQPWHGLISHLHAFRLPALPAMSIRKPWRLALAFGLPAILCATLAQASMRSGVADLPSPLIRLVQSANDFMVWHLAPVRDGLRWIEVEDPRSRRGDKLPTTRS